MQFQGVGPKQERQEDFGAGGPMGLVGRQRLVGLLGFLSGQRRRWSLVEGKVESDRGQEGDTAQR